MFDIVMMFIFGIATAGILYYAFKPVLDTINKDEEERKHKKSNSSFAV